MRDSFDIILDTSQDEARHLFRILKSLFDYPDKQDEWGHPQLEGVYYEIAFATLCGTYMSEVAGAYGFDETTGYVLGELGLTETLEEEELNPAEDEELFHEAITTKYDKICADISELFDTEKLQLRLFATLSSSGDYMDSLTFVGEHFSVSKKSKLIISEDVTDTCLRILDIAEESCRFSKDEFAFLAEVKKWFENPEPGFEFSFSASYSNNGESEEYIISNDGESFRVEDIHHVYEEGVGGDTFTSFQYLSIKGAPQIEGDLSNFELSAIQVIRAFGDSDMDVEVTISSNVE